VGGRIPRPANHSFPSDQFHRSPPVSHCASSSRSAPPFLSPSLLASVPRAWWSPPPTRAAGRAPVSPPLWLSRCRLQRAPRPSPTPYPRVRNPPAPHPHGTYAASPHPGHLVPSAYASCLICLICPFATGPFSIFFAAGPTAIFYTAWLSGCMACARARSPPPSRHTPFCIPVGRQAPPVPPASHFFCLRCIYLLSVICLPFLLCVCPLTGLCRKSITCNCRASARRLPCPPYAPSV